MQAVFVGHYSYPFSAQTHSPMNRTWGPPSILRHSERRLCMKFLRVQPPRKAAAGKIACPTGLRNDLKEFRRRPLAAWQRLRREEGVARRVLAECRAKGNVWIFTL